jgi:uncharacterized glyoxalase superfamily metalloenzyme YdcJ
MVLTLIRPERPHFSLSDRLPVEIVALTSSARQGQNPIAQRIHIREMFRGRPSLPRRMRRTGSARCAMARPCSSACRIRHHTRL